MRFTGRVDAIAGGESEAYFAGWGGTGRLRERGVMPLLSHPPPHTRSQGIHVGVSLWSHSVCGRYGAPLVFGERGIGGGQHRRRRTVSEIGFPTGELADLVARNATDEDQRTQW